MRRFRVTARKVLLIGLMVGFFVSDVRPMLQEPKDTLENRVVAVFQEGRRLYFQGEFEKAKEKFREAFAISKRSPGGPDVVSLKYEGLCFQYQDELDQALDIFRQTLQVQERYHSTPRQRADTLISIGWTLYLKGDFTQALVYLKKAEAAIEKAESDIPGKGPPWLPGTIMTNIGAVYTALGNTSMAFRYLRQVVEEGVVYNDKMNQTRALQYLGNLERSWGNFSEALECYEKAVRAGREAYDQPYNRAYLVDALNDLGALYSQQGIDDQAQAAFGEALTVSRQLGTRRLIARSLINLGNLARDEGTWEVAHETHQQALNLGEEAALKPIMGLALAELGWDSLQTGNTRQAISFFQRALVGGGRSLSPDVRTRIFSGLAEAYEGLGDWKKAETYYRLTIESIERVRLDALSEDRKIGFWKTKQATFERAISLLYRLHQKDPQAGYDAQAFSYAERSRARTFLDLAAEAKVHIRRGISREILDEERAAFRAIAKIRKRLLGEGLSRADAGKLERKLSGAENRLGEVRQRLRLSHAAYAALHYPQPLGLKRVRSEVLDSQTLLIEYLLGDEVSFVWAVSQQGCQMVALPGRKIIEREVRRYRQAITSPPTSKESFDRYFYRAHHLYNLLLRPIGKALNQHAQLLIVPDGLLHYLPFETLVAHRVTRRTLQPRFLIADHQICYASSASVLGQLPAKGNESIKKDMGLLAYADPVFARSSSHHRDHRAAENPLDGPRRGLHPDGDESRLPASEALVDMTRVRYRERGMSLDPLPYTREEVRKIAKLFPKSACKIYVGEAATESSVKRERLSGYTYLHFATHGLIDEGVPARSGVVLSLIAGGEEDGILQMSEIFNLELNADLVVLSACQSGLGKLVRGEGIIGLTRAFTYAGASSVVVSLWNVRDSSTARFMEDFYRRLRAGKSKAEALRQAKLDMIASDIPAYRFPYFWAPFVLTGHID